MLDVLQKERNIPKDMIVSAIEAAILSAFRKKYKKNENIRVKIESDGDVKAYAKKTAVETLADDEMEITLDKARKIDKEAQAGSVVEIEIPAPEDMGRIAAQTAKQVIIQRMREAEKEVSYDEFSKKAGEIVTGIIQQRDQGGYLVNLGRIETILPFSEVPYSENLRPKDRVKLYVVEVNKASKGPVIVLSRSHPNLVKKLFELEIPEIADGVLEIIGVAREAGRRTKIAVQSKDPNVSVVGTCVGHMGARIQNIVKELGNERIDIIEWKDDPKQYISNSISPAKPIKIELDAEKKTASVTVSDSQLSLAIGREGQNVRLASRLTGWNIDIKGENEGKVVPAPEGAKEEVKDAKEEGTGTEKN